MLMESIFYNLENKVDNIKNSYNNIPRCKKGGDSPQNFFFRLDLIGIAKSYELRAYHIAVDKSTPFDVIEHITEIATKIINNYKDDANQHEIEGIIQYCNTIALRSIYILLQNRVKNLKDRYPLIDKSPQSPV